MTANTFDFKSLVNPATGRFEMPEDTIILEALNAWAEENKEGVVFTLKGARAFTSVCDKVLNYYYAESYDQYDDIDEIVSTLLERVVTIPGYVDRVKKLLLDIHTDLIKLISPLSIIMAENLRKEVKLAINYLTAELLCLIEAVYQGNETEAEEISMSINKFVNSIRNAI